MFEKLKNRIKEKAIAKIKEEGVNAYNKTKEEVMEGKEPISKDNTIAAINLVKFKIERVIFYINLVTTFLFLLFYAYMIFSRKDIIANVVIYSVMAVILIVSSVFDIILYPGNERMLNFLDKKHFRFLKNLKRNVIAIVKLVVKLASLGYATYELIAIDSSTTKLMTLIGSYSVLLFQIMIYFIADLAGKYANYVFVGFNKDLDDSGILYILDKTQKDRVRANEILRTDKEKEILAEIEKQKEIDAKVKQENNMLNHQIALGNMHKEIENKTEESVDEN